MPLVCSQPTMCWLFERGFSADAEAMRCMVLGRVRGNITLFVAGVFTNVGTPTLEFLLDNGATVHEHSLYYAIRWNQFRPNYELMEWLVDRGANINVMLSIFDWTGTLLHRAAPKNMPDLARWLLDHGADREVKNSYGETALDEARSKGPQKVVEILSE
jgi:hypothetical protein